MSQSEVETMVDQFTTQSNLAKIPLSAAVYAQAKSFNARVTMALRIEYERNGADISADYFGELNRVGKFLNENTHVTAWVESHAENTVPATAAKVSQLRAQKVVDYLVEKAGVSRSRLSTASRLSTENIDFYRHYPQSFNQAEYQSSRRVSIVINYPNH